MTRSSYKRGDADSEHDRLQRLATLGSLAATSADELGQLAAQLLASLHAAAEALDAFDRDGDPRDLRSELDAAIDASKDCGERLSDIARRMVSCAEPAADELELADATELADRAIATVLPTLQQHAVLHREYESALPRVRINRGRMHQALLNLILNAIQACQRTPEYTNHCITVEVRLAGEWVCVDVRDTGPGVDEDVAGQIFDPFFTTRRDEGAVGLGLSVARAAVTQVGGHLINGGQPGQGAVFTIALPAA